MNFGRILANAFARRIAFVIVALLFAWMGIGQARAQTYDQGSAWQACQNYVSSGTWVNTGCYDMTASNAVAHQVKPVGPGSWTYHIFNYTGKCSEKPSQITTRLPLNGSQQCINGCMTTYAQNGDDETSTRSTTGAVCTNTRDNCAAGSFYNAQMNVCQPIVPDCPEGEEVSGGICKPENKCPDGMVAVTGSTPGAIASGELYCKEADNECPAGNIKSPAGVCLPGEGQCAAGEARKEDGTCGIDANNDGVPDSEDEDEENDPDKESFSGGDSCESPPSCEGGPIDCGMARISWRIDCNTRRNVNITGGTCASVPICTGEKCNAMEYAQLVQTWKSSCALEKLANAGTGSGEDNTNGQFEDAGTGGILGSDGYTGDTGKTINDGEIEFDTDGFGYGNTCPGFPTVDVFGTTIEFDTDGVFCDWMRLGGIFVMIMAHLAGLAIVIRS